MEVEQAQEQENRYIECIENIANLLSQSSSFKQLRKEIEKIVIEATFNSGNGLQVTFDKETDFIVRLIQFVEVNKREELK